MVEVGHFCQYDNLAKSNYEWREGAVCIYIYIYIEPAGIRRERHRELSFKDTAVWGQLAVPPSI